MGAHELSTTSVDAVRTYHPECKGLRTKFADISDPKTVTDEEYGLLYQATFKDFQTPLTWTHFAGDSGEGVSFRALIYVPSRL